MKKNLYPLLFVFFICSFTKVSTQVNIYVKIVNPNLLIEGESIQKGYERQIDANSFAQEESNCADCYLGGPNKAKSSNFVFTTNLNKAVLGLRKAMYKGDALDKVIISFVNTNAGGQFLYYEITLENVHVVNITDAAPGNPHVNEVQLAPAKCRWKYWVQNSNGSGDPTIQFFWNFLTDTGG